MRRVGRVVGGAALVGRAPKVEGSGPRLGWAEAMEEDEGKDKRFSFRVSTVATVTVGAVRASEAREALGGLLDGATARVVAGPGMGIELVDLKVARDVTLLLVDGIDPVEPLRRALSDFERRGSDDE